MSSSSVTATVATALVIASQMHSRHAVSWRIFAAVKRQGFAAVERQGFAAVKGQVMLL